MLESLIKYCKGTTILIKNADQRKIKQTRFKFIPDDIKKFNEIYSELINSDLSTIRRTKSGSLSMMGNNKFHNSYAWDVRKTNSSIVITVIYGGIGYNILMANVKPKSKGGLAGTECYYAFRKICEKYGIDLDKYKVKNGKEIKKQIEKPLIYFNKDIIGKEFNGKVRHIDFHSAYSAGLIMDYPEFKPVMEELYNNRDKNPNNKLIMNATIGYFQSLQCCGAKFAMLSKAAINNTKKMVQELADKLEKFGAKILGFNTDGIWFVSDKAYHDENEGDALTQWHYDYYECNRFIALSDGKYGFQCGFNIHPVIRGVTKLDFVKPDRSDWTWEELTHPKYSEKITYKFDKIKGIVEA